MKENTRLLSLDVFRGLTVAAMILVNNPGDWGNIYAPLKHAPWHGCTPTDLIFPFFLFIVGVSIVFSFSNKNTNGVSEKKILVGIFKRGLILFLLGIILALFPNVFFDPITTFENVRIPGVLQRIAIVYIFCAMLFYKTGVKAQVIAFFLILIVYWALITLVPVPGVGAPNLEAETNLGAWIDRTLLTEAHLWNQSRTWDPEGILSTLPAFATGVSGLLAGYWLRRRDINTNQKVGLLIVAGTVLAVAGSLWNVTFPMNKALWTSSFVLFTSGIAIIALSILYLVIDVKGFKWFCPPFAAYGVNAITVFFMSTIIAKLMNFIKMNTADGEETSLKTLLYNSYFVPNFSPINASLAWAISFVLLWLIILYWMYKKKIFIKV